MKRIFLLCLCCLLWAAPALGSQLPLVEAKGSKQFTNYDYRADYLCDVWVFDLDAPVGDWLLACLEAGFTLQKGMEESYTVYRVRDDGGLEALVFPNYSGAVMLMVPQGMTYGPPPATPEPRPKEPAYHWETITVDVDCPACVNGVCDLCKGTGVFRLYGTATDCSKECGTCKGIGTYPSSRTIKVYD